MHCLDGCGPRECGSSTGPQGLFPGVSCSGGLSRREVIYDHPGRGSERSGRVVGKPSACMTAAAIVQAISGGTAFPICW